MKSSNRLKKLQLNLEKRIDQRYIATMVDIYVTVRR